MFRGRGKHVTLAVGATILMAAASLAIVPLTASAQGSGATSVAVAAHPAATVSGHPLTIVAKVTAVTGDSDTTSGRVLHFTARKGARAATANASVPTGTVTFTITGSNESSISCKTSNVVTIKHSGK